MPSQYALQCLPLAHLTLMTIHLAMTPLPFTVLLDPCTTYPSLDRMWLLLSISYPNTCKHPHPFTCKLSSAFYVISSTLFSMISTLLLQKILISLHFVMRIGVVTTLIGSLLVPTSFILAPMPFHGHAKKSPQLRDLPLRLNTTQSKPPCLNSCGYNNFSWSLGSKYLNGQTSSQIISVLRISVKIQCSIHK